MMQDSGMARHALQRLLGLIPTLLMLITVAFLAWNIWVIVRDKKKVIPGAK